MSYRVELSSGKVFSGLELSGTCFESVSEVKAEDFAGGLSVVKVKGTPSEEGFPEVEYELESPKLGGVKHMLGKWYFWFEAESEAERVLARARADIDYIAMMTGVEL